MVERSSSSSDSNRGERDFTAPDRELLGRLDERTKAIQSSIEKLNFDIRLQMDQLSKKLDDSEIRLEKKIENIERDLVDNYVNKQQFNPIQRIVYGVVGLILVVVAGSVLALVLAQPKLPLASATGNG